MSKEDILIQLGIPKGYGISQIHIKRNSLKVSSDGKTIILFQIKRRRGYILNYKKI